jgi:hypothetical protein
LRRQSGKVRVPAEPVAALGQIPPDPQRITPQNRDFVGAARLAVGGCGRGRSVPAHCGAFRLTVSTRKPHDPAVGQMLAQMLAKGSAQIRRTRARL